MQGQPTVNRHLDSTHIVFVVGHVGRLRGYLNRIKRPVEGVEEAWTVLLEELSGAPGKSRILTVECVCNKC